MRSVGPRGNTNDLFVLSVCSQVDARLKLACTAGIKINPYMYIYIYIYMYIYVCIRGMLAQAH